MIDTAPQPDSATVPVTNGGVSVHIRASNNVSVTRLEAEVNPGATQQCKMVIWDLSNGEVAFQTPAASATAGRKFIGFDLDTNTTTAGNQPFQMIPGGEYHIAAMCAGLTNYFVDTATTENANSLETRANGSTQSTFGSPNEPPNDGLPIDARVRIHGFLDFDGDGIPNNVDNCPVEPNPTQTDKDTDGLGDACDPRDDRDLDNDTIFNTEDNCPFDANTDQADKDVDGLGDVCDPTDDRDSDNDTIFNTEDNCPFDANTDQADSDMDGTGNACDPQDDNDLDNDTVPNLDDNCPFDPNPQQEDGDEDDIGDACDGRDDTSSDEDNDGILNGVDNCPFAMNPDQKDSDGDGVGDVCDFAIVVNGTGCAAGHGEGALVLVVVGGVVATIRRRRVRA